jgi:hypothetical protein
MRGQRSASKEGAARGSGAQKEGTARRAGQLDLPFPATWGGARRNAGRKPSSRPSTPHRARPRHLAAEPVHVTLRARLSPLRSQHLFRTIRLALTRAAHRDPKRFRLLHFSVQRDHVHLIVEASDKRALSSGVRGIAIRIARDPHRSLRERPAVTPGSPVGRPLARPRAHFATRGAKRARLRPGEFSEARAPAAAAGYRPLLFRRLVRRLASLAPRP